MKYRYYCTSWFSLVIHYIVPVFFLKGGREKVRDSVRPTIHSGDCDRFSYLFTRTGGSNEERVREKSTLGREEVRK